MTVEPSGLLGNILLRPLELIDVCRTTRWMRDGKLQRSHLLTRGT
jgi:hypothetical protein